MLSSTHMILRNKTSFLFIIILYTLLTPAVCPGNILKSDHVQELLPLSWYKFQVSRSFTGSWLSVICCLSETLCKGSPFSELCSFLNVLAALLSDSPQRTHYGKIQLIATQISDLYSGDLTSVKNSYIYLYKIWCKPLNKEAPESLPLNSVV